ncbi:hypothetical protein PSYAR_13459 [Pseudomonas syringae pv. aceris str. M302273]|nr:hypothetical protein PSYAR_13459 [Pseudomonas syringae pv. aceris str. M302273]
MFGIVDEGRLLKKHAFETSHNFDAACEFGIITLQEYVRIKINYAPSEAHAYLRLTLVDCIVVVYGRD